MLTTDSIQTDPLFVNRFYKISHKKFFRSIDWDRQEITAKNILKFSKLFLDKIGRLWYANLAVREG